MQGKRAYRLKKKIPSLTGISRGEFVVIDALHKDHLEVYDKHGDWIHAANFDGTKNVEKTNQGLKGNDRLPLREL
jgi:filamentous hemagglutinin